MKLFRLLRQLLGLASEEPSPAVKQLPTAFFVAGALVSIVFYSSAFVTNLTAVLSGAVLMSAATLIAIVLTPRTELWRYSLIVPAIDCLAIGLLRYGTGVNDSPFVALIVLPVIWLAAEGGRRHVTFATLGVVVMVVTPFVLEWNLTTVPDNVARAITTPAVYAVASFVINELSRQARRRERAARELAQERTLMLQRTIAHAEELSSSEQRLRRAESMARGVWEAVTEQSVIGTDTTGLIDAWGPGAARLLGMTDAETEGKRYVTDFHVPQELDDLSRELNFPPGETVLNPGFSALVELARLGNADVREWTYVDAEGNEIPVSLAVTARQDDNGTTVGYLFVASDLTVAQEVARLKDEFLGLVSHELRTPLSSILGYLELMRDDDEEPLTETQLRYLSVAERNANRLLRLVGDLLFTAQVDAGAFPVELRERSFSEIVTASVESATPAATAARVNVATDIRSGVMVLGDGMRLGQACDNLISNAIKFTPAGGTVTVTLGVDDGRARLVVEDTGMGIAAEELDKLFTRFFRASTAIRNAVPGIGLGLVISKAIVTAHGGEMDVTSEEGKGASFHMLLPLHGARTGQIAIA